MRRTKMAVLGMMITNIFSLKLSSVTLILAAGIVSLCIFKMK